MVPENSIKDIFQESMEAKAAFLSDISNLRSVARAAEAICECIRSGGKVLAFGNGGSASDSQHFAAELVVRFEKERRALACIALNADTSIITAASNDYDFSEVFSRQIEAIGKKGDIVFAVSTSGMSENVINAVKAAREMGISVISLTGGSGGRLVELSDIPVNVSTKITARIQEVHSVIIHAICKIVEDAFSDDQR